MTEAQEQKRDEAAYRRLKVSLDQKYPAGHFVAIYDGRVVGDAAVLDDLLAALRRAGLDPRECLAVQAGVDYPEKAVLFLCSPTLRARNA